MPRRLIAILLILSLSYQCFVKLGIVVWYYCNKDYIAANLCENRARPEKKCCGKCYLNKQLKKAEHTPDSRIPEKWNMGEVMVFTLPAAIHIPFIPTEHKARIQPLNESYLPIGPPRPVFHPPAC